MMISEDPNYPKDKGMDITKAIEVLQEFIEAYDYHKYMKGFNREDAITYKHVHREYLATKVLIEEYNNLRKEVTNLAIESVNRDVKLGLLEAEVVLVRNTIQNKK